MKLPEILYCDCLLLIVILNIIIYEKIIFLIVSCLFFFACSNEKDSVLEPKVDDLSVVEELNTLSEFNDSILKIKPESRGILGRFIAIISADAIGAYTGFKASVGAAALITAMTGGVAGPVTGAAVLTSTGVISAGASYSAYCGCSMVMPYLDVLESYKETVIINSSVMKNDDIQPLERILNEDECHTISLLHDSIVGIALNASTNYSSRGVYDPIDDLGTDVKHIDNYNSYGIPLITDNIQLDLINQIDSTLIDLYRSNDYEKVLSNFVEKGIVSIDSERIMDLFFQAVNGYVVNEQDLEVILYEYRKVVSDSPNLTLEDKNSLLIAFAIMQSSFNYWQTKI